ncbi:hypothetical protein HDF16_004394 [Granulicella aggregans]|uniref:Cysteine peptidase C11 family protein n=1 Tax=Granulicella aggregans TaxID=474949 RepID=A0A7W7ZH69_9BACT|nr:clostripain-related cysteine peptidase [Granulicella aggregans]MBB5059668.1 hypothetical protein [Granulicella aggregans]
MSEPWKILMYIAADNSLFDHALVSLRQTIEASRLGTSEILVQFDGPDQDSAARFRVAGGRKAVEWEAPAGYTADRAKRLEHFLDWAAEDDKKSAGKSPIFLVLWGHGAGLDHVYVYATASAPTDALPPKAGVKDFFDAGDANIYVKDIALARVFRDFTKKIGRKIDVLGLDACLMGLAEIAHEVRESVEIMVSSDEDIPDASFPYREIVGAMETNSSLDGKTLAQLIVDKYVATYNPAKDTTAVSLSALELSTCDAFAAEFKSLVKALLAGLTEETSENRIVRAREFSRTQSEPTYIDLFVFLTELTESFDRSSDIYRHAGNSLHHLYILHHRAAPKDEMINSHGLAIYFPKNLDPEQVAAASPTIFPVQPAASETLPAPQGGGVKTPPHIPDKSVLLPGGATLPIKSYQILWSEYIKLEFNRTTGWSTLVRFFLPEIPKGL